MAIQMTVNLTEQEYTALRAEAARQGKQPEMLLHEFMEQNLKIAPQEHHAMTGREAAEQQYREGKLSNLATHRPLDPEEEAEWERFVQSLDRGGKPLPKWLLRIEVLTNGNLLFRYVSHYQALLFRTRPRLGGGSL